MVQKRGGAYLLRGCVRTIHGNDMFTEGREISKDKREFEEAENFSDLKPAGIRHSESEALNDSIPLLELGFRKHLVY